MDVQFIKITGLVSLVLSFMTCASCGYSYSKFRGPVSGPERLVKIVHDDGKYHHHHHPHPTLDYVAKPDYHFAYGVSDPKSMVKQSRQETRLGDNVKGEYSVLDPDGRYRTVKYTADKHNGFQAEIFTDDDHHGHTHYPPAEYTPNGHAHEVHHHEEDGSSYNEEESSEDETGYDETDDTSDKENSGEDGDAGDEYY